MLTLFAVVGYVPTLVVAAICVYIGVDFLYDNLVVAAIGGSRAAAAASYAVAAACVRLGMPAGAALGVAAFQAHAAWAKKMRCLSSLPAFCSLSFLHS